MFFIIAEMKKIKIYCNWDLDFELYYEKQIELYIDSIPKDKVPENTIRFLFLLEPPEIINLTTHALNAFNDGAYNYLFTHNQELLDAIPGKSFVMPLASTWIKNYEFPDKKFEVSTLVGGKRMAEGHLLRQKLWFKEDRITIPKKFFLSGNFGGIENYKNNPILGNDKAPLFYSQFHICIENTKRRNWFTEKLIDCLQTKTVPIYYGCPNIEDWFDIRGFIIANDLNEIINACNGLTPDTYNQMLPYIEENYNRSMEYTSIDQRLKNKIKEIIN
jgi:hypothetical protein